MKKNDVETTVDSDEILWLNEKYVEEGLAFNLRVITVKYPSDHRKHRYELVDEPKNNPTEFLMCKELATKVMMDCKITAAHIFRARLGFKKCYVMLTKEQSVLTKMKSSFKVENMQTEHSVLRYRIDVYFHNYKLAVEIDEN